MLKDLIYQVEEAYHSEVNQQKIKNKSRVRLFVGFGRTLLSELIGFKLIEYFNDPVVCFESQLKWKLFWHNEICDDTPVDLVTGVEYAVALEPSLFGVEAMINPHKDPTYGSPIINKWSDLDNIEYPDFFKSGLMPRVHKDYEQLRNFSEGHLKAAFPGWARGPWSVATILRGFNDIFLDMVDNPEFVHRLMQFAVDSRIKWDTERSKFLKTHINNKEDLWKYSVYRNVANCELFEDEVDGNLFSPKIYEEFVFPYEKQLAEFYGGIRYYHSCGKLTSFFPKLSKIDGIDIIHISPWTDMKKAVENFSEDIVLQKSLHPINDVILADEEMMEANLKNLILQSEGRKLDICADAIYEGSWQALKKVQTLIRIFRRLCNQFDLS